MNKSKRASCKTLFLALCLISLGKVYGQKESRTYDETFSVNTDALLNIDTSHADIEFETWTKNEVAVMAFIEIEGATKEEAKRYFEKESFEIVGNSKQVVVKTKGGNRWRLNHSTTDLQNFNVELPELPQIGGADLDFRAIELPEIAEMPELPQTPVLHFNYRAFSEDGEDYMKEWQKELENSFGKDYQERMEEWAEKMEGKQEERVKRQEELSKRLENRAKAMEKRADERLKRFEAAEKRRTANVERQGQRNSSVFISQDDSEEPHIFYFSSDGDNKNYRVKKTIKIKMPKGMKIKMNVRHGDVKLADNVRHMNAQLAYSSLWAASIDGDKTLIKTSYSPVRIDRWFLGNLQANYSENVQLNEVHDIKLNTTSSNVKIDKLLKTAYINNDLGQLEIGSITKDFTDLDVTLRNAEFDLNVPNVAFDIYVNNTSSTVTNTAKVILEQTQNHDNIVHEGYHIDKKGGRSIVINSKYSEVKLH